jgi:branched-subunit amino acid aminotransferase/4-amino-4-deoxychorismate lyase
MNEPQAFLNGRFIPAAQATISLVDTGFVQGTTIAEQLRTFGGRVFHVEDHLARLEHSAEMLGITIPMERQEIVQAAMTLVARNHALLAPGDDLGLSIFLTPGPYAAYCEPGLAEPTFCMHTYPLPFRLWVEKYEKGQALVTTEICQVPPQCWSPTLKCRSRMHYYLADRRANQIESGARAVLLDQEGCVTEASTANLLVFREGEGLVSPAHGTVLPGISLATISQLAERLGIPIGYHKLFPDDLAQASEIVLSSTPFCLLPATRFNGRPIGGGRPGPVFTRLLDAWSRMVGIDIAAQARTFASRS